MDIEGISPDAIAPLCGEARAQTWRAVEDIAKLIAPGMSEKEAIQKANQLFAERGVKRFWHKTHVRFGKDTINSFNDGYEENVVLTEDDVFYIDVGPVWNGVEGDAGKTFVVGDDPKKKKIATDVELLFANIRDYWREAKAKGPALLRYAENRTKEMGYLLHPSYVEGHRLSEFPHMLYSKASLYELDKTPASARWILELQICDSEMKYGAFYEDLLM